MSIKSAILSIASGFGRNARSLVNKPVNRTYLVPSLFALALVSQFSYADDASCEQHAVLRRGARLLRELQEQGAADDLPRTATQLAMLAVQIQPAFMAHAALFDELDEQAASDALCAAVLEAARALMATSSR